MKFLKWFADNSVNPIHVLMALLVRVFAGFGLLESGPTGMRFSMPETRRPILFVFCVSC